MAIATPLETVATQFKLGYEGSAAAKISGLAALEKVKSGELSFFTGSHNVLLEKQMILPSGCFLLVSNDCRVTGLREDIHFLFSQSPRFTFFNIAHWLLADTLLQTKPLSLTERLHNTDISNDAQIAEDAVIESGATIAKGCRIASGVYISSACRLGENVQVQPNTVLGVEGASFERDASGHFVYMPHIGELVIGANTRVGANAVICKAVLTETHIGEGCYIGHRANIGHNCRIEDGVFVGAGAMIAGSVKIESEAWIAPGSQVLNKKTIGTKAIVGLGSVVLKNVRPHAKVTGNPAQPIRAVSPGLNRRNSE